MLIVLDRQSNITSIEGRALEPLHQSPEQLIGHSFFELYPDTPDSRAQLDQAFAGSVVKATHIVQNRTIRSMFLPLTDEKGSVTGIVLIGEDATDDVGGGGGSVPTSGQRDSQAAKEGPSANDAGAMTKFLRYVSHEMRTPLNSLIGFADLLAKNDDGHLNQQDRYYLDRILSNATHVLDVVGQMLDLSLTQSGIQKLKITDVDLEELIKETLDDLRGLVTEGSLEIVHDVPKGTHRLKTDRQKLKQVLINLAGNALKYTSIGMVMVRVHVDRHHRPLRIDVIDTGEGIREDHLGPIFRPFDRGRHADDKAVEGTGLGLTISQSLCELLGYTIGVTSEMGKGSTFSIHLVKPTSPAES